MSIIVIQLQGGLVQDVFVSGKGAPTLVYVVDEDVDDIDEECLTKYETESGSYEAAIHTDSVKPLPKGSDMALAVKAYDKAHR
jgi:hypothetical protein